MGCAMGLCILNCLYSAFIFPETLPQERRVKFAGFSFEYLQNLIIRPVAFMWRNRLVACLAFISFLGTFPQNGIPENSLLFLQNQVGFMPLDNAWVFFETGFF